MMKTKTTSSTPQYLSLDFDTARKLKWERGVKEHRKNPTDPFNGEPCDEGGQECLDLYNYLEDIERRYAVNLSIQKSMVRQIWETLKVQHRRLTGA